MPVKAATDTLSSCARHPLSLGRVEADRCTRFRGISHHGERSKQVLNLTTAQGSAVARRSEPSPVFSLHSLSSHEVGKGVVASAHFLNKLKSPFLKSGQVKLRARARALLEPFISESRSRSAAAAGSCMSRGTPPPSHLWQAIYPARAVLRGRVLRRWKRADLQIVTEVVSCFQGPSRPSSTGLKGAAFWVLHQAPNPDFAQR